MPANAIEKIEIITQPGAEFPATSGGAILNIITNKNAKRITAPPILIVPVLQVMMTYDGE
jgi:outer membrane receptor for ferrienterochelin and colicin